MAWRSLGRDLGTAGGARPRARTKTATLHACTPGRCVLEEKKRHGWRPGKVAVGKAGSECFPDCRAACYCQTLCVSERSPQKIGCPALARKEQRAHAAKFGPTCCAWKRCPGGESFGCRAVDGHTINANHSHYKCFLREWRKASLQAWLDRGKRERGSSGNPPALTRWRASAPALCTCCS